MKREIGSAQQGVDIVTVVGSNHYADARLCPNGRAVDLHRNGQHFDQLCSGGCCINRSVRPGWSHDDCELVATQPSQHVVATQRPREPSGDRHQHMVARRMAQGGVDVCEVVEIQQEQSERFARGQRLVQHSSQPGAIAASGQLVVLQPMQQVVLRRLVSGHVQGHADDPMRMIDHRHGCHFNPPRGQIVADKSQRLAARPVVRSVDHRPRLRTIVGMQQLGTGDQIVGLRLAGKAQPQP